MNNTSTVKNVVPRINYTSTGAILHLNSGDFSITGQENDDLVDLPLILLIPSINKWFIQYFTASAIKNNMTFADSTINKWFIQYFTVFQTPFVDHLLIELINQEKIFLYRKQKGGFGSANVSHDPVFSKVNFLLIVASTNISKTSTNYKRHIRVNTFDQVINELLKEHENRKNDRQQNIHTGEKK